MEIFNEIFAEMDENSLYFMVLKNIAANFDSIKIDMKNLPPSIVFDICLALYKSGHLCSLKWQVGCLAVFNKLLNQTRSRCKLHNMYQALEEHGAKVGKMLYLEYVALIRRVEQSDSSKLMVIDTGLRLGTFLNDAAWYDLSEKVLMVCKEVCDSLTPSVAQKRLLLDVCHHLLRVQAVYCNLNGAAQMYENLQNLIKELKELNSLPNLSSVYTNIAYYFTVRNEFQTSYEFSMLALGELNDSLPPKSVIDTLRQASKSCVVKRKFDVAGVLIRQAVNLAAAVFGETHPKFADAQLDYGFFLLNYDSINDCVLAYEIAHRIKSKVFLKDNIHVAVALEDLAYALYVYEYSSGRFQRAQQHAEAAIDIMQKLLPSDHIMLSSAQRVKALILEEVAIDNVDNDTGNQELLKEAEQLHLCALRLGREYFGEKNVQTAKHYGNLGRLYQSMRMFQDAELMHKKAIEIKEAILGPNDYEVGLSLGHLASLYNYHMGEYDKAIHLYLRSIQISLRLFGPGYSGLEYDYRGLIHVYTQLDQREKVTEYSVLLSTWRLHRNSDNPSSKMITAREPPRPIAEILNQVFNIS